MYTYVPSYYHHEEYSYCVMSLLPGQISEAVDKAEQKNGSHLIEYFKLV